MSVTLLTIKNPSTTSIKSNITNPQNTWNSTLKPHLHCLEYQIASAAYLDVVQVAALLSCGLIQLTMSSIIGRLGCKYSHIKLKARLQFLITLSCRFVIYSLFVYHLKLYKLTQYCLNRDCSHMCICALLRNRFQQKMGEEPAVDMHSVIDSLVCHAMLKSQVINKKTLNKLFINYELNKNLQVLQFEANENKQTS